MDADREHSSKSEDNRMPAIFMDGMITRRRTTSPMTCARDTRSCYRTLPIHAPQTMASRIPRDVIIASSSPTSSSAVFPSSFSAPTNQSSLWQFLSGSQADDTLAIYKVSMSQDKRH